MLIKASGRLTGTFCAFMYSAALPALAGGGILTILAAADALTLDGGPFPGVAARARRSWKRRRCDRALTSREYR